MPSASTPRPSFEKVRTVPSRPSATTMSASPSPSRSPAATAEGYAPVKGGTGLGGPGSQGTHDMHSTPSQGSGPAPPCPPPASPLIPPPTPPMVIDVPAAPGGDPPEPA